jgi:hypothetical protein
MFELTNRDYAHFGFDDYDLEAQLIAIKGFLVRSRTVEDEEAAEIKRLAKRAEEIGSEHLVGMYTDAAHASVYSDAARAAAAIGMLAPFVENLFTGLFREIGKMEDDYLGRDKDSKRSKLSREHFWNPHVMYATREAKQNLTGGIMQLAEATRLLPRLPVDTTKVLEALFEYRNAMLHDGFEWPLDRREKFAQRVKTWEPIWFMSALSNHKPWVWYATEAFFARVLDFIDEVMDAAGAHVREVYYPDN